MAEKLQTKGLYTGAWSSCWSCGQRTAWYHWPGVPFCETKPPDPMPATIEHRHSRMFRGSYWMNTCAECGAAQGDNYVFLDPSSPLHALPQRDISAITTRIGLRRSDGLDVDTMMRRMAYGESDTE